MSTIQSFKGISILMVDDSADNQDFIHHFLKFTGAKILTATNGMQAVDMALKTNPDLILMDIEMPELDGYGATQQLRRHGYAKPIVALTAHNSEEERERCLKFGFNAHLAKPFDSDALIDTISLYVKDFPRK